MMKGEAQAVPYAYASNQISGLTITYQGGGLLVPGSISGATQSVNDSASYGAFAGSIYSTGGAVGTALDINQAYSGPGPAPASSFVALGAGSFVGTRSDAGITAGSAVSGGVDVNTVVEGQGNQIGNSQAGNSALISFNVTGTGQALEFSFTDIIALTAMTGVNPGEFASADISNQIKITDALGHQVDLFSPTSINTQVSSSGGVASFIGPITYDFTGANALVSSVLTDQAFYTVSLTTQLRQNIAPGRPIPEPMTLALMGTGLLGLGMLRRRRST
jgi:hypothetical protein